MDSKRLCEVMDDKDPKDEGEAIAKQTTKAAEGKPLNGDEAAPSPKVQESKGSRQLLLG